MQHVASEMQRDDYFRIKKIPLLIGGATTSRVHTAVKIAPHYEGPVVYVPDASRSVGVCSELLSDERAAAYVAELEADYDRVREQHANKKAMPLVTLAEARANKTPIDWAAYTPPVPKFIGRRVLKNQDLAEIAEVHRLGPVLPDLGARRPVSGDPHRRDRRRVGAPRVLRRQAHAARASSRAAGCAPTASSASIRRRPSATTTSRSTRDESRSDVLFTWRGLRMQSVRPVVDGVQAAEPLPGRLHRAQGLGQERLHRPVRGHRRASASRRRSGSSPPTSTTTAPSC